MKILIVIMMFIILNGLLIISNNNLNFTESKNIKTFGKLYLGWTDQILKNIGSITGNIIKSNWTS